MPWEKKGDAFVLNDGVIYLSKRENSKGGVWHYRIRLSRGDGYIRKSTYTNNIIKAQDIAYNDWLIARQNINNGIVPTQQCFMAVAEQYLFSIKPETIDRDSTYKRRPEEKRAENRYKNTKLYLEKFMKPHLHRQTLRQITNDTLERIHKIRYNEWAEKTEKTEELTDKNGKKRTVHYRYLRAPGAQSKNTINRIVRNVYDYAVKVRLITPAEVPHIDKFKIDKVSRGGFSHSEWEQILKKLDERIQEIPEETQPETKYQRTLFKWYMIFMAATGLRPGEEPRNLKWKHINYEEVPNPELKGVDREINTRRYIFIQVNEGKTGERLVIGHSGADLAIEAIRRIHPQLDASERTPVKNLPNCEKYIWVDSDGKRITTFKNAFSRLMKSLGWKTNDEGKEITPYSLRHYYATQRLYDGVSPMIIADNMGTSLTMIWSHYKHTIHKLQAAKMAGKEDVISTPVDTRIIKNG
jgi:integrase